MEQRTTRGGGGAVAQKTPGHATPLWCALVGGRPREAHLRVIPALKNPIYIYTVAMKKQPGARSGTLSEGEIITRGHLHDPYGLYDEEGVVHPRGRGFVPVAMCLISLSLSLSLVFLIWHGLDVSRALLI